MYLFIFHFSRLKIVKIIKKKSSLIYPIYSIGLVDTYCLLYSPKHCSRCLFQCHYYNNYLISLKIVFSINLYIHQVIKQQKSTITTLFYDIIPLHHYRSIIIEEKKSCRSNYIHIHMCIYNNIYIYKHEVKYIM